VPLQKKWEELVQHKDKEYEELEQELETTQTEKKISMRMLSMNNSYNLMIYNHNCITWKANYRILNMLINQFHLKLHC